MKTHIEDKVKRRVKGEARKKVQPYKAEITKEGQEVCDPQPIFEDIGFTKPPSMDERIRRITAEVQAETAAKLAAQNMTEEEIQAVLDEENDFEIPDAFSNTLTQYEAAGLLTDLEDQAYLEAEAAPTEGAVEAQPDPTSPPAEQSGEAATGSEA